MDTLVTVIVLGLSVEGLVLCPLFAFGLSLTDRLAGLRFLLGRLVGLILFGCIVSLLGKAVHIDERIINFALGLTIMALGIYRAAIPEGSDLDWKLREIKVRFGFMSRCRGKGRAGKAGFGLGLIRALCNPGRKYLYLAPLLLDLGVIKGLAVSFVYGVSSSVYLLLGIVSAAFVDRLMPHKLVLSRVGGTVLVVVGGYYVWKGGHLFL